MFTLLSVLCWSGWSTYIGSIQRAHAPIPTYRQTSERMWCEISKSFPLIQGRRLWWSAHLYLGSNKKCRKITDCGNNNKFWSTCTKTINALDTAWYSINKKYLIEFFHLKETPLDFNCPHELFKRYSRFESNSWNGKKSFLCNRN